MKEIMKRWLEESATVRVEGNNGNSILWIEVPPLQRYLAIDRRYSGDDLVSAYKNFVADHAKDIVEAQGLKYDPKYHLNVVIG